MTEAEIQARIMLKLGSQPEARIFRNHVAEGWTGEAVRQEDGLVLLRNARRGRFGLCPGSTDLIGWRTIVVTPDLIGQRIAAFLAVEVKSATGRPSDGQRLFVEAVRAAGGLAGVAKSPEQALLIAGLT
jgi:hypothetical protein